MESELIIRRIKNYSIIAVVVPLITITSCLFIYKFLGSVDTSNKFNFDGSEIPIEKYFSKTEDKGGWSFIECPKYKVKRFYVNTDDKVMHELEISPSTLDLVGNLKNVEEAKNNNIKSVIYQQGEILNTRCVKNYPFMYQVLKNFSFLEEVLVEAVRKNTSGFAQVKNPYFYGEVSISRTARYFPALLIFKPFIILSALFLFLYWKNNLNLFKELENKKILNNFSRKFFYLGILSCIFLILHASFLGIDSDSKLFSILRRLIIILFIFSEMLAQIFLTKNLFTFKNELKNHIRSLILRLKITFVTIILLITLASFFILAFLDPSTSFKHTLEWNYFSFLLLYYFLSRLLWR